MRLLISQKNHLFDVIIENNLSPTQFEFTEIKNSKSIIENTRIQAKNANFYFVFIKTYHEKYNVVFCPLEDKFDSKSFHSDDWQEVIVNFDYWIKVVKKEIQLYDKWQRLIDDLSKVEILNFESKDLISAVEYEDLKVKINIFKAQLQSISLSPNQFEKLINKLNHVEFMALTLAKNDWNIIFVGSILYCLQEQSVHPDIKQIIWNFVNNTFGNILIK